IALLFLKLCGSGFAEKFVPKIILSADKEFVMAYLRGCFGDGYIDNSGSLAWKLKNPPLISQLAYLLMLIGVLPSISGNGCVLYVTGRIDVEKLQSVILHEQDATFIAEHLSSVKSSPYRMPKAFPVVGSRLLELRQEIGRHNQHDLRSRHTYRHLCEIRARGFEGGINREFAIQTLGHLLSCAKRRPPSQIWSLAIDVFALVRSDLAFDPISEIKETEEVDEYVYDISVPGAERFIGGRSGLVLHNSAGSAHLRELTTPDAVWLGVWASVPGDEPVIVEQDGLIRNEKIGRLFSNFSEGVKGEMTSVPTRGTNALCCSRDGRVGMMPVKVMTRHTYDGDIYQIRTLGGYTVKTTGNHSIEVFNPKTFSLESKPACSLSRDDLVAACFSMPNNQSLTQLNLAKLITTECPEEADRIFVEGPEAEELCNFLRGKYTKKELRRRFYQVLKRDTPKLSYFL